MAGYKKIRDLGAFTTITKDHIVPVATPVGLTSESTGHTTTSNLFGAFLGGSSSMELDANGKLKIRSGAVGAEQFEPGALEDSSASVQNATTATEMADLTGAILTIATGNFGKLAAIVITDHPAANDIGPDPREISITAVNNSSVSCIKHGFGHPTSTTRHEVTIYSEGGEIPSPLDESQTYFAQEVDVNSFQLFPTASGGSAIVFSDTGTGILKVRRRSVFALQNGTISGSTYSPNAYNAYWGDQTIVAVNNVFASFEGAYNWILRNNAGQNLVFNIGSADYPRCNYNQPGSDTGRLEVDPEFTNVNKFRITGNRWNGTTDSITSGALKYSGSEPTGHDTKDCARLVVYLKTSGLQFWVREAIHKIQFIGWIYDAQNSGADAPNEFYRSGALGAMVNCSWTLINFNGGGMPDSAITAVGEGTNTFMTGDTFVDYYGGGSNNWSNTITANNVRIVTTLQGGRGFLFPHGPSRFAIKSATNTVMGKVQADWLYVNAAAEATARADLSHNYQAASALLNEATFKTY